MLFFQYREMKQGLRHYRRFPTILNSTVSTFLGEVYRTNNTAITALNTSTKITSP